MRRLDVAPGQPFLETVDSPQCVEDIPDGYRGNADLSQVYPFRLTVVEKCPHVRLDGFRKLDRFVSREELRQPQDVVSVLSDLFRVDLLAYLLSALEVKVRLGLTLH